MMNSLSQVTRTMQATKPSTKKFDTLIINANIATFNPQLSEHEYGMLTDHAIGIIDGTIVWIGNSSEVIGFDDTDTDADDANNQYASKIIDVAGKWVIPSMIDCHTHLVYAGNRSNEFEARLKGVSYTDIAKQGGGILSTVTATRQASEEELYRQSEIRLKSLLKQGVSTIEIKSGYGLDFANEEKMLKVAKRLGDDYGITVKKTYLAAHALPPEFKGSDGKEDKDGYIDKVCEWLPILHSQGLVDAVDGFIEAIAFDKAQITRVFDVAQSLGIPVKLHSEQITNMGGTQLVAKYQGLSSDHIEQLTEDGIKAMASSNTVAVLLPGAFYTLRDETVPPIELLRQYGVPMAVSTDCNPGTSPSTSLLMMMNMACTLFGLTPEEALKGTTRNSAQALGLQDSKGMIGVGMDADLTIWNIERPADLSYAIGLNPLDMLMINGELVKVD